MRRNFVIVMAAAVVLSGCGGRSGEQAAPRTVNVQVQVVESSQNVNSKSYVGVVEPSKSTVLSSRYPGTLVRLAVSQGQRVAAGAVIAEVDAQSVKSTLETAEATLEQAQDAYDRLKQVYESGSVAEVKMVEIETKLAQAEASVKMARQAYDDCTIKAPYAGVISDVYVDEGIELSLAEPIAKIVDASSLEITFPVPEGEIGDVAVGEDAYVTVPALGDQVVECRISKKGVTASPLSHSYECTLKPTGAASGLMPGMVSKVYLSGNGAERIVIPAGAVKTGEDSRYVWVAEDGKAKRVDVTVGGFSGDGVIVTSGLQEGDRLIVKGGQKVSTGMSVNEVE